jgi:uncharacterized protein YpmB
MILEVSHRTRKILIRILIASLILTVMYSFVKWANYAAEDFRHAHKLTVDRIIECLNTEHQIQCRVDASDGEEYVLDGLVNQGRTVYKECWIKDPRTKDATAEWCYTNLRTSSHYRNVTHEQAWQKQKQELSE